ncbi:glutaredoxin family protein [Nosocomiicoccus ampullae]|uniref:glutaredoxin family protein n=1 Tax=Nosocomiicoccus ampullae TaxID=489910 RepID=UPI00254DAE70|nr:glutaredoxin family protein [Nosocomiicoccus ampullae]MDK6863621.1 glutaredoxin family protein [Nosocomiicoccus ampullae]
MKLVLYTSPNCKLCEDAKLQLNIALESFKDVEVSEVDITSDDTLHERFLIRVPVVMHKDEVVQEGIIDFFTIHEYIEEAK